MDMVRVDETGTRETTEVWTVRNADGMPHDFHVHDVQFRVVEVNGEVRRPRCAARRTRCSCRTAPP
ncbi:multicopper oxidase domain-containing protein [Streptomyces sp. CRN 30]|uniref:multicopper oxidase domain-containing protein n=1 Tax=Streptomyces sp. CRN 30 TaxID=3075613 RepID=UPI002A7F15F9|nr:multicopper oxidase domain-containing protein [Streptomyces sp. CRN 30]